MTVKYETPRCRECGNTSIVEVDENKLTSWLRREMLIHEAFPEMTAEEREVIMTGTHPSCWNKMFAHEFVEDDGGGSADGIFAAPEDREVDCIECGAPREHEIHTFPPNESEATFHFIMSLRNK